jgi:hypothetical protein
VWLLLAAVVATVRAPELWRPHLVALAATAAGFAAVWWCCRRPVGAGLLRAGALGAALLTVVLAVFQHRVFPVPPSPERNMPALARDYLRPLPAARGDVLVVGGTGAHLKADPTWARESLSGSAWYLGRRRVQNGYTTISFRAYKDRYCINYEGSTCPQLLDQLFSTEPTTGRRRVDLLSVGTLLLVRTDFPGRLARGGVDAAHRHLGTTDPGSRCRPAGVDVTGDEPGPPARRRAHGAVHRAPGAGLRRPGRDRRAGLARVRHRRGDRGEAAGRLSADRRPAAGRGGPDGHGAVLPARVAPRAGGPGDGARRRRGLVGRRRGQPPATALSPSSPNAQTARSAGDRRS